MIESLKDLEKLLKLCRKQGVTEIKLSTVELKLGDMPYTNSYQDNEADPMSPYINTGSNELPEDVLAFYNTAMAQEP